MWMRIVVVFVGPVLASGVAILEELFLGILPASILGVARVTTKSANARGSN